MKIAKKIILSLAIMVAIMCVSVGGVVISSYAEKPIGAVQTKLPEQDKATIDTKEDVGTRKRSQRLQTFTLRQEDVVIQQGSSVIDPTYMPENNTRASKVAYEYKFSNPMSEDMAVTLKDLDTTNFSIEFAYSDEPLDKALLENGEIATSYPFMGKKIAQNKTKYFYIVVTPKNTTEFNPLDIVWYQGVAGEIEITSNVGEPIKQVLVQGQEVRESTLVLPEMDEEHANSTYPYYFDTWFTDSECETTLSFPFTYAQQKIHAQHANLPENHLSYSNGAWSVIEVSREDLLGDIVIPRYYDNGMNEGDVTEIGQYAFRYCYSLTSITIPNSVRSIGTMAFARCSSLSNITIPNSVINIGDYVHSDCESLISITVAGGNTVYDSRDNCNAIIETETNTLIAGCQNTTILEGVTTIDIGAFNGCSGLTALTIPSSVVRVEGYSFYGCSGLTNIVVKSGNTVYDSRDNCNAIIETETNTLIAGCNNTVTIPEGVTSIGDYAFESRSSLTSITIPNSVTSIGFFAFARCKSLGGTNIIPNSVTSIDKCAFAGCKSLTSITIPNGVTSIEFRLFDGCESLTNITIPSSVTSIGGSAFYGCTSLTNITIPSSVTSIGDRAFCGCTSLSGHNIIPQSVTSIGDYAFYNCKSFGTIILSDGVTKIGRYAFGGCSAMIEIQFEDQVATWYKSSSSSYTEFNDADIVDVTDSTQNAIWLRETKGYYDYYWYKK